MDWVAALNCVGILITIPAVGLPVDELVDMRNLGARDKAAAPKP